MAVPSKSVLFEGMGGDFGHSQRVTQPHMTRHANRRSVRWCSIERVVSMAMFLI